MILNLYQCNYCVKLVFTFDLVVPLTFAFRLPAVTLPVRLPEGQPNISGNKKRENR